MIGRLARPVAIFYLLAQVVSLAAYWGLLVTTPSARDPFVPGDAPDSVVLAFAAGDLALYLTSSLAAAWGLWKRRGWVFPALCFHAGVAVYAAVYALSLAILEGSRWTGAAMMAPALVMPPLLVWYFRPGSRG